MKNTQTAKQPSTDETIKKLKKEWGGDFDAKLAAAQAIVAEHPDLVDALDETGAGNDFRVIKFFAQLAEDLGVSGEEANMSPAQAKAAIARIMKTKNYQKGDKQTVDRVTKLHGRAYASGGDEAA